MPKVRDYKMVRKEGGTRVISIGTLLPKNWHLVRIVREPGVGEDIIRLRIEKVA